MALIKESEKSVKWQEKNRRLLDLECGIRFHFGVVPQTIFTSVATAIVIIHSFIHSFTHLFSRWLFCPVLTWLDCGVRQYRTVATDTPYRTEYHHTTYSKFLSKLMHSRIIKKASKIRYRPKTMQAFYFYKKLYPSKNLKANILPLKLESPKLRHWSSQHLLKPIINKCNVMCTYRTPFKI